MRQIKTKILAAFTGMVVMVSLIFLLIITTAVSDSLRKEFLGRILVDIKGEAAVISDMVVANDVDGIVNYIFNEKFSHQDMAYLLVLDQSGKLLASTLTAESPNPIIEQNTLSTEQNQAIFLLTNEKGEKIYDVEQRIPYNKGLVISGYFERQISDSVWKIIYLLIATMCGLIMLALVYAVFFSGQLVKPFGKLVKTITKVAAGNFKERAVINSKDEIGYFAEVLNKMLDNLENLEKNAVSKEEKKYQDLIENTPLCIKVFDKNKQLTFINKGGREEHSIADDMDISNWDWVQTVKTEYQAEAREKFDRAFKYGEGSRIIFEHTPEGSNRQWCSSLITPVKDKDGKIDSVLFLSSDISQMKQIEAESEQNAELFRSLLDSVPFCIKWYDGHGKLISINQHGKKEHYLEGKSDEEIRGWHFANGVMPEYKEKLDEIMIAATHGQAGGIEVRHFPETTTAEWTYNSFVPIMEKIEVKYILMISRDITEEKKSEIERAANVARIEETKMALFNILEDVKESEKSVQIERDRSQSIISSMGEGLVVINKDFKISLINKKAEELTGVSAGQMVGMSYMDTGTFLKGDQKIPIESMMAKIFETGETVMVGLGDNLYYQGKMNDKKFPIELIASPMKSGGNEAAVVVFQDITKLKELDEAKSSFISIASHQLRTPLTSIRWYAELLASDDSSPLSVEQKDFVDRVYTGALKLSETINLLLSMARIESGKTKLENIDVAVDTETADILRELEPTIKVKNLTVTIKKAQENIPVIKFDAASLRQVISNLLTNSIRYSDNGGRIEIGIGVEPEKSQLVFSVKDDGIGIPDNAKDKIFGKFFRANNAMSKAPDGSGLGLALVKNLVELWHGKIWFESPADWSVEGKEIKKGTIFYFTMPFK